MNPTDILLSGDSGAYTAAEIAAANRRHDQYYGWSPLFPSLYTNLQRLPETTTVPAHRLWENRPDYAQQTNND